MPHLTIECSPGLCNLVNCEEFLTLVHEKIAAFGIYQAHKRRSRLHTGGHWLVGDGTRVVEAAHILLVAKKRQPEVKAKVAEGLYSAARAYLDKQLARTGVEYLLSVEMQDCGEQYIG